MTNAIEEALDAAQVLLLNRYSSWPTGAKDPVFSDGEVQLVYIKIMAASRALAALSAPTPSGLTEEERAELAAIRAKIEETGVLLAAGASLRAVHAEALYKACRTLLRHAEALLSPAPGIDWKRVAEVRERHEACDRKEHPSDDMLYEAHADRAFLLSLLPKQEKTDGQ